MKLSVAMIALGSAISARADYPIVAHSYAADPAAVEFNGRLYLYCSNDNENGTNGYLMSSITCFSTDDLKNWTDHGVVFRATNTSWATLTWAPSAISNNNKIFLYFANGAANIGVATSSVPTGPFVDARGSALITGSTPGASTPTQWLFDPCAFIDTDGLAYLYFGGQYPTNARVIQLSANLTSVSGSATEMFATNFFEASYMHKRSGIYYYTYCNRFEVGAAIYCETNSNPTTGFVPQGTVLANPPQNVNNNNHHSIVSYLGNWYIAYHNRAAALANGLSNGDAVYKRSLCLDAVNYDADGSIQQVTPTTDGLTQLKNLDPFKRVEAETIAQQSGIKTEVCGEGGLNVTSITNGSWIRIRGVNFSAGAAAFYARVASAGAGGNIELRLDSVAGTIIGTCAVAPTGGWQSWTTVSANVSGASGVHDLYLKFTGGAGNLFNMNWWQFQFGPGAGNASPLSFEAELGVLGANWAVSNSVSPAFTNITIVGTGAGGNPGSAARVASYTVTFPAAGTYELYVRIRCGAGGFNDDSMFYGNGFGAKSATTDNDWILMNGLAAAGYTAASDVVVGNGAAGSQVWKWVNLSQFTNTAGGSENPITFNVTAGNLTQTFQIGAREDGLDFDKVAFALTGYTFTVANLDAGGPGTAPAPTASISTTNFFQTIEGFGGAIAFYNGWVTAHPYKDEIMTNAFAGLNLSMLRLGNWFRYQGTTNFDPDAPGFVTKANQLLGRPVQVLMSSWAPPAFLKSNGQVGNGGTLLYTNGGFAYNEFAQYWYDSLVAYRNIGVSPNWVSIQNEPDWEASYDSCIFRPTEGMYNGTNWAGYSNALSATYLKVATLPTPPKFLGPEPVGIGYSVPQNYAATMNPNHFYGFNYHLYHGSTDGSANGYVTALRATTNLFPTKPRFMTEFGVSNMIESATLIHNCLTEGQVSGYNHWSLIWPNTDGGLIQIEFPWNQAQWTNAPPGTPTQSKGYWLTPAYWAMKHFSYYVTPGSRRIAATNNDPNIKTSAYLTEDNLRLVAVFINRNLAATTMDLNFAAFPYASSGVYQTAGTNKFQSLGAAGSQLTLPPESLTTVVLDKFVAVGPASNPSPANGAASVALSTGFNWTAGSNALLHAVYRGLSSNAVFSATTASAEFKGYATNNSLAATALSGSSTYYWRVDEIAGANTNTGVVWSFSTVAGPVTNSILPVADSYVESSTATSNYGSLTNVTVKNNVTVATRAAYLMFDVRSLSNVQSATLKLLPNRVDDPAVPMYYEVAATNWTEAGINWNNQPGGTGQYFATNTVTLNVPVTFNVTSLVANKATNGGLFSIRISQPTNSLNGLIMFCSKECSVTNLRPVLEYVIPPNTAPTLATNSNRTIGAGMVLSVTNNATDTDTPTQTLTFSLLTAPTNAVLNTNSGLLTWRPLVTQAGTTNPFTVKVADNGSPSLSATQSFVVTVTNLLPPQITSVSGIGALLLQVNGASGPDYQIQSSTNLTNWNAVFTTNAPSLPFTWTNTNNNLPQNFFRVRVGPPLP